MRRSRSIALLVPLGLLPLGLVAGPPAAAATGPVAAVASPDDAALGLPGSRLVFSTVRSAAKPARSFAIRNTGTTTLTVSSLAVSGEDASSYKLASGQATSLSVAPGSSASVGVLFTPTAATNCPTADAGGLVGDDERYAKVGFTTNDPAHPSGSVTLGGINACNVEGNNEPLLSHVVRSLGYTTKPSTNADVRFIGASRFNSGSDEVAAPYFLRSDASKPVTLTPVAHYSGRNKSTSGFQRTGWYDRGAAVATPCSTSAGCKQLYLFPGDTASAYVQNQKLLPAQTGGTTFSPTGAFGLWTGDYGDINFSDDGKNVAHVIGGDDVSPPHYVHAIRSYLAYGPGHVRVNDTWLVSVDISRTAAYKNNDFQDVVFVLRNAKLADPRAAVPGSAALSQDLRGGGTVSSTCATRSFDGVLPDTQGDQCAPSRAAYTSTGFALTSSAGQLGGSGGKQQNAFYKAFDASLKPFTVKSRVVGPVKNLTANYQQIATWFGPDQDNYVKVELEHNGGGGTDPHVTMFYEEKGVGGTVATLPLPAVTSAAGITLFVRGNTSVPDPVSGSADTGKVKNYPLDELTVGYQLDGGSPVVIGSVRRPADVTRWFSTSAKGGLLVSGGNSTSPFTATFSSFAVSS